MGRMGQEGPVRAPLPATGILEGFLEEVIPGLKSQVEPLCLQSLSLFPPPAKFFSKTAEVLKNDRCGNAHRMDYHSTTKKNAVHGAAESDATE